uniref:Uncharacterized protein n=1 Tax=Romanomermis culicivorax TaxID=13658 RepID=A0A915KZT4_ROMCU
MAERKRKMRLKEKERRKKGGKGAKVEEKEEDSKTVPGHQGQGQGQGSQELAPNPYLSGGADKKSTSKSDKDAVIVKPIAGPNIMKA